jgi:hypothetical protein
VPLIPKSQDQTFQGRTELAPQSFGLIELPPVKFRAVPQTESKEEIILIQIYGFAEEGNAVRANLRIGMTMSAAGGQKLSEGDRVGPRSADRSNTEVFLSRSDESFPEDLSQLGETTAQVGSSPTLVVFGPVQSSEGVAAVSLIGHYQVGEQRHGFLALDFHCVIALF